MAQLETTENASANPTCLNFPNQSSVGFILSKKQALIRISFSPMS